jgi:hypothetical protein
LVLAVTAGAVKAPLEEIVPADAVHCTDVSCALPTFEVKVWEAPLVRVTEAGLTLIVTGGWTITVAEALLVGSALEVAVTVTLVLAVTVGAVKTPLAEIVPEEAVHCTDVSCALATCDVKVWAAPLVMVIVDGLTLIVTAG